MASLSCRPLNRRDVAFGLSHLVNQVSPCLHHHNAPSLRTVQLHDLGLDLRRKRGPISHQIAPTLEQVCPPVRGLGLILDCVGECSFRNLSWVTG